MTNISGRVHFMDPLRGILMMLGVFLHAAQVFNPDFRWLIQSPDTTQLASYLVGFVHVFRMPAFYIVSGFFTLLALRKHPAGKFLKLRAEKILVPLIATALTLNIFETWVLHSPLNASAQPFQLLEHIHGGRWLSHLWFLAYLFAYVLIVYFARSLLVPNKSAPARPKTSAVLSKVPAAIWILILPLYYLGLVTLGKLVPQIFLFRLGLSIYDFLYYFQFFAWGLVIFASRAMFESFTRLSTVQGVLLLALWYGIAYGVHMPHETLAKIVEAYARLLIIWISCQWVFSLFRALLDRPSRWATFASSASYTVYLFHHCLIILGGLILIRIGIGGIAGFLILVTAALSITSLIHFYVIEKSSVMAFLFNGKRQRPRA